MKTLIPAAIRCSLMFTGVAALSLIYPASVQAVPTTYQYTGNPFTQVFDPYTTSDFVTAMITLASPLAPNFSGFVSPSAFTFSDGVQTIPDIAAFDSTFYFTTDEAGAITGWFIEAATHTLDGFIVSESNLTQQDLAVSGFGLGAVTEAPGEWAVAGAVADTGSTLLLMTLTLLALGLLARRFQRAAA